MMSSCPADNDTTRFGLMFLRRMKIGAVKLFGLSTRVKLAFQDLLRPAEGLVR